MRTYEEKKLIIKKRSYRYQLNELKKEIAEFEKEFKTHGDSNQFYHERLLEKLKVARREVRGLRYLLSFEKRDRTDDQS